MTRPVIVCILVLFISFQEIYGQNFLNEDLDGIPSFFALPTNWQNVPASDPNCLATLLGATDTPDLISLTLPNALIGAIGAPYSGNTFSSGILFDDTANNRYHHEGIMQTVSHFVIGNRYVINLHQAVVKQSLLLDNSGSWTVYLDSNVIDTTIATVSNALYNSPIFIWEDRNVVFTATDTIHTIKFLPSDDDPIDEGSDGLRMGIDSINLLDCNALQLSLGKDTLLCPGDTLILDARSIQGDYLWQDGSTNSTYTVTQTGTYWVNDSNLCGTFSDTIIATYNPYPVFSLGSDTLLCSGDTFKLDVTNVNATYFWSDSSTNSSLLVTEKGDYWVERTEFNCSKSDTISVFYDTLHTVFLGKDTTLCDGDILFLNANTMNADYLWYDGSTDSTNSINSPGNYWVDVTNVCATVRDSITVTYNKLPSVNLGVDTVLCDGDSLRLHVALPSATYLWQNGSDSSEFTIKSSGLYWVEIFLMGCFNSDSIVVAYEKHLDNYLGNDTSLCIGDTLNLKAPTSNTTYSWQNGFVDSTFMITKNGRYWLQMQNVCGKVIDTIEVAFNSPVTISLGRDTTLCSDDNLILNLNIEDAEYLWSDSTESDSLIVHQSGTYWVQIKKSNCISKDTIHVNYDPFPLTLDLGNDTIICDNDSLLLVATNENATYLWNNGSTDSNQIVTQKGLYQVWVSNHCGIITDSIFVDTKPSPFVDLGSDTTLCETESLVLDVFQKDATYLWKDSSLVSRFNITKKGLYWVESELNGCKNRDSILVNYIEFPESYFASDTSICEGDFMLLNASTENAVYKWQNGSSDSLFFAHEPGVYEVEVSIGRCFASDEVTIERKYDCDGILIMPNVFTPNSDGDNDLLMPITSHSLTILNTQIYNRWGHLVYATKDPQIKWNGVTDQGAHAPNGVYFMYVDFVDFKGINTTFKSHLTLYRQ